MGKLMFLAAIPYALAVLKEPPSEQRHGTSPRELRQQV